MEVLPARILVMKLSSLGDIVHTLPAVAALRKGISINPHQLVGEVSMGFNFRRKSRC